METRKIRITVDKADIRRLTKILSENGGFEVVVLSSADEEYDTLDLDEDDFDEDELEEQLDEAYDDGYNDGYDTGYADGYLQAKKEARNNGKKDS